MPTNDPIAAARREAKTRARKGGTTHQQALDEIAREAGHANWAALATMPPAPRDPVRAFVELMRPNGGVAPDDTLKALTEDAINGYLAEEHGTDIASYVDRYEYRGDGFDVTPDAFQRDILENAIAGYVRASAGPDADAPKRGPDHPMPFLVDEWPMLEPPGGKASPGKTRAVEQNPTLADLERDVQRIMARAPANGMTVSKWVSQRMREAAMAAGKPRDMASPGPHHVVRSIRLNAQTMAQAVDPDGGPWEDVERLTVRCPLHDDANGSLVIGGTGTMIGMRCMAGCDDSAVQTHAINALARSAMTATAFMRANDRAKVVEGAGRSRDGRGGRGGAYTLTDGSRHELDVLAARMLPEGYPDWAYGNVAPARYAVETALRVALAGRHPISVAQPDDVVHGTWRLEIAVSDHYRIAVTWGRGRRFGISAAWSKRTRNGRGRETFTFPEMDDETHPTKAKAVERVLALVAEPATTDKAQIAVEKAEHEREIAYNASIRGEVDGWGWWTGPDETGFRWGGPYKTRSAAISEGNGHCSDVGEVFYVIQARLSDDEPGEDGMREFAETRGLKAVKAT